MSRAGRYATIETCLSNGKGLPGPRPRRGIDTGPREVRRATTIRWTASPLTIVTHPRVFAPPSRPGVALDRVAAWLEASGLVLLAEGPTHWATLRQLVASGRITGAVVHDACIFALCRQHGVDELWTAGGDLGRFRGLRVRNPLVG